MENTCETCGRDLKDRCAECESEATDQGKCIDCGSEDRAMKCAGCNESEETCPCDPKEDM